MDIVEVIRQRKSIRAFKPDAVPQEILREIVELALRAPSWANTQPWELAIAGGRILEDIKQNFILKSDEMPNPELAAPEEFPEPFISRRRKVGRKLYELKEIGREDTEKRRLWRLQGLRLFEAPNVIYIYTDRAYHLQGDKINVWPVFDCGIIAENIMLLATNYGLGTIPQIQAVNYPAILREMLDIPDSKIIVLGIAIGYPDWKDPVNSFYSEREPTDKVARWYGFE